VLHVRIIIVAVAGLALIGCKPARLESDPFVVHVGGEPAKSTRNAFEAAENAEWKPIPEYRNVSVDVSEERTEVILRIVPWTDRNQAGYRLATLAEIIAAGEEDSGTLEKFTGVCAELPSGGYKPGNFKYALATRGRLGMTQGPSCDNALVAVPQVP
jgi:hypothetical protein